MNNFSAQAYELQADFHRREREAQGEQGDKLLDAWFDESSADYWRQARMYGFARLFAESGETTWLTIGDGRYGIDSIELGKRGIKNVLPTDISEFALKRAKENNLIKAYAVENAERLGFKDEQFDYVVCKESFHHFPRPFIALYEMLRVAREGVVIVEPNDFWMSPVGNILYQVKRLLGRSRHIDQGRYEEAGNYVYTISERELEKACLGLDLPHVFFKGINDVYLSGTEFAPAKWTSPLFLRMRIIVAVLDLLCILRLFKPTRLTACIFKREPSAALRRKFLDDGWKMVDLPRNPYRTAIYPPAKES